MTDGTSTGQGLDSATEDFAQQVADSVASSLLAVRAIAAENDAGHAIPLLLLELTQVSLTGARLGVQTDFVPREESRSEERRVGTACVRKCIIRWSPCNSK